MLLTYDDLPVACDCNQDGSQDLTCNRESGQCNCHDGITNRTCNSCINEGFWGPKDGQCRNCTCVPDNTIECVQVSNTIVDEHYYQPLTIKYFQCCSNTFSVIK